MRGYFIIKIIKKPSRDEMVALIRAKQFLDHAKSHANEYSDFNTMIAIHNLDNANEYILKIIIKHLNIEEVTGRTINTSELSGLIGEIDKFAKTNKLPQLPFVKELKCIREMRNLVQHAMINPNSDLKIYIKYSFDFFNKVLIKYFGISEDVLTFSLLIKDRIISKLLTNAEKMIKEKEFLKSIVFARNAFEYSVFKYTNLIIGREGNIPAKCEVNNKFIFYSDYVEKNERNVILNNLGVDIIKYFHYLEYVNCIPKEFCSDWHGNIVLRREWKKDDADFCLSFVSQSILNMQENMYFPIQDIPIEYKNDKFVIKLNGLDITNKFSSKNCTYFYEGKFGYSFYIVGRAKYKRILNILNKKIVCKSEIEIHNNKVISDYSQFIMINSKYIKNVSNEPAIWEVYFEYVYIPFSRIDNILDNRMMNIDKASNLALLKKKDSSIISSCLPLDSLEKAFELKNKLKNYYDLNLNSLSFIKNIAINY